MKHKRQLLIPTMKKGCNDSNIQTAKQSYQHYISNLYGKLDIVAKCKTLQVIVELAEMKENLLDNIGSLNEAIIVLE